jgi:hypothetical protein
MNTAQVTAMPAEATSASLPTSLLTCISQRPARTLVCMRRSEAAGEHLSSPKAACPSGGQVLPFARRVETYLTAGVG